MGEKKSIFHAEEFQIMLILHPKWGRGSITFTQMWAAHTSRREVGVSFAVEKPNKYCLSQVIKINIQSHNSC